MKDVGVQFCIRVTKRVSYRLQQIIMSTSKQLVYPILGVHIIIIINSNYFLVASTSRIRKDGGFVVIGSMVP